MKLLFLLLSVGVLANDRDLVRLYNFHSKPGYIEPSGSIIYTNNIYKRMNNIEYTLEKKINDPFGKNITIDFYRVNYPFVWFNLPPLEFAN